MTHVSKPSTRSMWGIASPHLAGIRPSHVSGGSVMWVSTSMTPKRSNSMAPTPRSSDPVSKSGGLVRRNERAEEHVHHVLPEHLVGDEMSAPLAAGPDRRGVEVTVQAHSDPLVEDVRL